MNVKTQGDKKKVTTKPKKTKTVKWEEKRWEGPTLVRERRRSTGSLLNLRKKKSGEGSTIKNLPGKQLEIRLKRRARIWVLTGGENRRWRRGI